MKPIHIKYRRDIDGLRAISVISVVLFHAFPEWIPGGFIGVDIFFVISGYLITTIIFENLSNNTFSFNNFFSRRILRIFPTLSIVLISCYLSGSIFLFPDEYKQLGKHIAGGAGFLSNFVLWEESGYFDNIANTKPLLHLWSLGIEEQFYIVWPLLLWLAWKFQVNFFKIIFIIALLSFIINIATVHVYPVAVYYSPLSRFWELLFGAALAYTILYKKNLVNRWNKFNNPISIFGLSIFVVSIFLINKHNAYPGWWALLPTLTGTLLIFAGPNTWINQNILSNKLLVWCGLISFPLYLWHWPLLSFAHIFYSELNVETRLVIIFISILLAWLTYRFIECPIRDGKHNYLKIILLAALVILIGYEGLNTYKRDGFAFIYKKSSALTSEQTRDLTKWEAKGMYPKGTCYPGFVYPDANICLQTKNNEMQDMIVFGDSHAFSTFWGISKYFGEAGHNVGLVGQGSGCLPLINQSHIKCRDLINRQISWINSQKNIETIFIVFRNQIKNSATQDEVLNFEKILYETLYEFEKNNKKIIFFLPVPEPGINPRLCVGRLPLGQVINDEKCKFPLEREKGKQRLYINILTKVLESFPNVVIFDPSTVLCEEGYCYVSKDGTLLWMDDNHITESASYAQGQKIFLLYK